MNQEEGKNISLNNNIIFVDLDGSLILSDSLWESILVFLKTNPLKSIFFPYWLLSGKASFKEKISEFVNLDVNSLPYRPSVLALIDRSKMRGQRVVLATAANEKIAHAVCSHLGVFDDVLSSSPASNLKGRKKLEAILKYTKGKSFDYIGDSRADIPIWEKSEKAFAIAPSREIALIFYQNENWTIIEERQKSNLLPALKALRIHQWAKNALLFVPLLLAHQAGNLSIVFSVFLAFITFSLCASATYIWNDLFDLADDRKHQTKKNRPLASGQLSIPYGFGLSLVMLFFSFLIAVMFMSTNFLTMLFGYVAITVSYTFYFKKKLMADVLLLAGLYTYRIIIGGVSVNIEVSPWLLVFSIFFFLSLAFLKRYTELATAIDAHSSDKPGNRGYWPADLEMVRSFGTSSGYVSVLVFALYLNSSGVFLLYSTPEFLWLICPCLIYWLSRIWFLAHRGQINEDPVLFSIRDRISQGLAVVVACLLLLATT